MSPVEALLVTQYYKPEILGSGPFCAELAEWLVRRGRRMTVLTSLPHYPDFRVFPGYRRAGSRREVIEGVAVERVRNWIPERASAFRRIGSELHFLALGALALATGRAPRRFLVLSLCPSILGVALGALAKRRGGKHVALVHDIQSGLARGLGMVNHGGMVGLMRWCERTVLNRVDLVVVLSQEMQHQLRAIGVAAPIEIVPIWVDADGIQPVARAAGDPPKVLYSGNLGRKQGLRQIIDLAEVLQQRRPGVEIVLRGNGSEASSLVSSIAARGLGNVRLSGPLPPEALNDGLAGGDVHLVPQDPQAADFAVPSKIFNIMAAGRPFVATARPGSSLWRLREATGSFLCVPPDDARAFADAVLRLIDDQALRADLGARGRRFIEQNLSKPQVLDRFLALLDGLYVG